MAIEWRRRAFWNDGCKVVDIAEERELTLRRAYEAGELSARSAIFRAEFDRRVRAGWDVLDAEKLAAEHERRTVLADREREARAVRQAALRRLGRILSGAVQRCRNPKREDFADYGGRGIEFRFRDVKAAKAWIEAVIGLPGPGQSLDRIDNDGPYGPGNVRWASAVEQARNRRRRSGRLSDGRSS